jgi:hypothetical protein
MVNELLGNPIQHIVAGLVAAGVYNVIKAYYASHSVYKRSLKMRRELAEKSDDSAALQQLSLEEKWLDAVESIYKSKNFSVTSLNQRQSDIDLELAKIYRTIPAGEMRLPSVDNQPANKHAVETFLWSIIYEAEDSVCSPNAVLPYPTSYLVYALNYVLAYCPRNKEAALKKMLIRLNVLMNIA